jgi:hypothetical protein
MCLHCMAALSPQDTHQVCVPLHRHHGLHVYYNEQVLVYMERQADTASIVSTTMIPELRQQSTNIYLFGVFFVVGLISVICFLLIDIHQSAQLWQALLLLSNEACYRDSPTTDGCCRTKNLYARAPEDFPATASTPVQATLPTVTEEPPFAVGEALTSPSPSPLAECID